MVALWYLRRRKDRRSVPLALLLLTLPSAALANSVYEVSWDIRTLADQVEPFAPYYLGWDLGEGQPKDSPA
jgi:hypothetical protein